MLPRAIRLGLTGGIGSGKSTVATLLNQAGATQIDADAISREATGPKGSAIAPIQKCFGPKILDKSGALNRDAVRQQIFSDSNAKSQLEAIIHPIVRREMDLQTTLNKTALRALCLTSLCLPSLTTGEKSLIASWSLTVCNQHKLHVSPSVTGLLTAKYSKLLQIKRLVQSA